MSPDSLTTLTNDFLFSQDDGEGGDQGPGEEEDEEPGEEEEEEDEAQRRKAKRKKKVRVCSICSNNH